MLYVAFEEQINRVFWYCHGWHYYVEWLCKLYYAWKRSGDASAGVIAQDVEKVMPNLVHTHEEDEKSVNYNGIIALLLESVKELKVENEMLRKRVERLEGE